MTMPQPISLLYPPGTGPRAAGTGIPVEIDLGLASIIRALSYDSTHQRQLARLLAELPTDTAVISYRQDILADLLHVPELASQSAALLPTLRALAESGPTQRWAEESPLLGVAARLAELECYVQAVQGLGTALQLPGVQSAGLRALQALLHQISTSAAFRQLAAELPPLRQQVQQAESITIGINLDAQLRPESATIVAIGPGRFAGKTGLLERLLGTRAASEAVRGITTLYKADEQPLGTNAHELFRDLNRLLERTIAPVAEVIDRYTHIQAEPIAGLEAELAFYLGAARFTYELQSAGLPLCRPTLLPPAARTCHLAGCYNLDLLLRLWATQSTHRGAVVQNAVHLEPEAALAIITGPNSGGKTTYARAVAQAHVLAQAGLLVPAHQAVLSPVDGIYSHFPATERLEPGGGRLAQELEHLAQIFAHATSNSLIILNEPFTSTDYGSARAVARDVLSGLHMLGARAIVVTHLRELVADSAEDMPAAGVVSLVAQSSHPPDDTHQAPVPTYQIVPGPPQQSAYALALAARYGLRREQLAQKIVQHSASSPAATNGEMAHTSGQNPRIKPV